MVNGAKFTSDQETLTAYCRLEARMQVAASLKRVDDVIPEFEDMRLIWRRSLWVLRYWSTDTIMSCSGEHVCGCGIQWGYEFSSTMLLEIASMVLAREDIEDSR